eukprot:jgi/Botrbrau1/20077/Bobra.200_1s0081.2
MASFGTGFRSLNGATGGIGSKVRTQVRGLGVRGLDLGFGCGVGLGYGFGVGLMLRPGVLEELSRILQEKLGGLLKTLPPSVRNLAMSPSPTGHFSPPSGQNTFPSHHSPNLPFRLDSGSVRSLTSPLGSFSPSHSPGVSGASHSGSEFGPVGDPSGPGGSDLWGVPAEGLASGGEDVRAGTIRTNDLRVRPGKEDGEAVVGLMRTVLDQQAQIRELQRENLEIKKAICKLDKKAPFCRLG